MPPSYGTVDADEGRDTMSTDIPNAFIQAQMPREEGAERVVMKITGVLVDLLVQLAPEIYGPFVVLQNGNVKLSYILVLD